MRIDVHTHLWPDKIAGVVMAGVRDDLGLHVHGSGTQSGMEAEMQANGIDRVVALAVATRGDLTPKTNDWIGALPRDRFIPFGTVHPDYADGPGEVERLIGMGFPGLKVHSLFQSIQPDDRRMYPVYEAVGDRMVVLFHAGQGSPEKGNQSLPEVLKKVRNDFPRLRMILAHWGGTDQQAGIEELFWGDEGIFFDTSAPPGIAANLAVEHCTRAIERHGASRFLYGSDWPFAPHKDDIEFIEALPIPGSAKEAILGGNAKQLLA